MTELQLCRMFHWKKVLSARSRAALQRQRYPDSKLAEANARQLDSEANRHMRFVQALNDFIPTELGTAQSNLDEHLAERQPRHDKPLR